jgi:hypothetical protein
LHRTLGNSSAHHSTVDSLVVCVKRNERGTSDGGMYARCAGMYARCAGQQGLIADCRLLSSGDSSNSKSLKAMTDHRHETITLNMLHTCGGPSSILGGDARG